MAQVLKNMDLLLTYYLNFFLPLIYLKLHHLVLFVVYHLSVIFLWFYFYNILHFKNNINNFIKYQVVSTKYLPKL